MLGKSLWSTTEPPMTMSFSLMYVLLHYIIVFWQMFAFYFFFYWFLHHWIIIFRFRLHLYFYFQFYLLPIDLIFRQSLAVVMTYIDISIISFFLALLCFSLPCLHLTWLVVSCLILSCLYFVSLSCSFRGKEPISIFKNLWWRPSCSLHIWQSWELTTMKKRTYEDFSPIGFISEFIYEISQDVS